MRRTVSIRNKAYLHTEHKSLVIDRDDGMDRRVPLDDIYVLVIDDQRVTLSARLLIDMEAARYFDTLIEEDTRWATRYQG